MKFVVLKYAALLAALSVSIYVLLVKYSFTHTIFLLVVGLTLLFVVLHLIESFYKQQKKSSPQNSFTYYTHGLVTKKTIRIGAYILAGGILVLSDNKVLLFGVILFGMVLSETISLLLDLKNHNYFIYFENKAIVITYENKKIFPSQIKEIEFRYDIFYFTFTNDKVRLIELDKLTPTDKPIFTKALIKWANEYGVSFSKEAKQKLGIN